MSKTLLVASLLSFCLTGYSQDSGYASDSVYTDSDYESDSVQVYAEDSASQYTLGNPALLPITKDNNKTDYSKTKFDKSEWKKIVGETNFSEKKKEKKKEESKEEEANPVWNAALLKIISYIIIFVLIIVILYFVIRNTLSDGPSNKKIRDAASLLYDAHHIDDVTEQDIDKLLRIALEANDFRSAIRLYYIRLLKHLHSSDYISWKRDKTNRDYVFELARTSIHSEFRHVTLAYEIIWYGERTLTLEEFKSLQNNFNALHTSTTALNEKK